MAKLKGNLRMVRIEEVARYLECNIEKLRIALKHLAAVPSGIQYSKDAAVSLNRAVPHVDLTSEEAAKAASLAAADAALDLRAQRVLDKILLAADYRLELAGGDYSLEDVIASAERAAEAARSRAKAEQAAAQKARMQEAFGKIVYNTINRFELAGRDYSMVDVVASLKAEAAAARAEAEKAVARYQAIVSGLAARTVASNEGKLHLVAS